MEHGDLHLNLPADSSFEFLSGRVILMCQMSTMNFTQIREFKLKELRKWI